MITTAPTALQIPAIRNAYGVTAYGVTAHSDTYAVDYGRVTGLVEAPATEDISTAEAEALADLVDAQREVIRLAKVAKGTSYHRTACTKAHAAMVTYRDLTGLTSREISAKLRVIIDCFA